MDYTFVLQYIIFYNFILEHSINLFLRGDFKVYSTYGVSLRILCDS